MTDDAGDECSGVPGMAVDVSELARLRPAPRDPLMFATRLAHESCHACSRSKTEKISKGRAAVGYPAEWSAPSIIALSLGVFTRGRVASGVSIRLSVLLSLLGPPRPTPMPILRYLVLSTCTSRRIMVYM